MSSTQNTSHKIMIRNNILKGVVAFLFIFLTFSTMTAAGTDIDNSKSLSILVVGATGATGKWLVKLLLDEGHSVSVVVRSKERMLTALEELNTDNEPKTPLDRLSATEATLLDLSDDQLKEQVNGKDAVVSCLGHNLNFNGMWGKKDKNLVTDAAKRLTAAMKSTTSNKSKFILMGTDGVSNPNGQDDERTFGERLVLTLLRWLIPPHSDNEAAAAFMHSLGTSDNLEWSVVRPTDLIDGRPTGKFRLFSKPQSGLFGSGVATRSHVAQCMAEFITDEHKWNEYKFKMPVLHDIVADKPKPEL